VIPSRFRVGRWIIDFTSVRDETALDETAGEQDPAIGQESGGVKIPRMNQRSGIIGPGWSSAAECDGGSEKEEDASSFRPRGSGGGPDRSDGAFHRDN
jgi:hypothetical protein